MHARPDSMDATSIERGAAADLPEVAALADEIWRAYYPGILSQAQIEYMLARGYAPEALARYGREPGAGVAFARAGGERVGFACWHRHGAATTKLDKLYVRTTLHGRGLGHALVAHVADAARADGAATLVLNVNKGNAAAIAFYERVGFAVRESVVVDIGGGFVMDDHVMAKAL
jgi:diamine N-acetyltransferase